MVLVFSHKICTSDNWFKLIKKQMPYAKCKYFLYRLTFGHAKSLEFI